MSDVETLLRAYPRIHFACHARHVRDPADGKVLSDIMDEMRLAELKKIAERKDDD